MDNLLQIINLLETFQKADYINIKDYDTANYIYYEYSKAIKILKEIETIKETSFNQ
jgi:hypothetical protein